MLWKYNIKFLLFLTSESYFESLVDPSKTGEVHLTATSYVYVLRLQSLLLKLPNALGTPNTSTPTPNPKFFPLLLHHKLVFNIWVAPIGPP